MSAVKLPERTNVLSSDPDTVQAILSLVAEGKHSLWDIAKTLGVSRRDVNEAIMANEANMALYKRAVEMGKIARQERIVSELEQIAFLDVAECFNADGNILPINKMPEHVRRAIQKMDEKEIRARHDGGVQITQKVEFYNRIQALELLGKNLRMFVDRTEVELTNPYQAVPVPVTQRLKDPDAIEGSFTRVE